MVKSCRSNISGFETGLLHTLFLQTKAVVFPLMASSALS
jgi:hypothetical protein